MLKDGYECGGHGNHLAERFRDGLGACWEDCFMADGWACVLLLAAPACAAKSQGICTGLAHPVSILRQDKAGG